MAYVGVSLGHLERKCPAPLGTGRGEGGLKEDGGRRRREVL